MADGVLSQILDACKLARELDASIRLSAVPIDPHYLSSSCEDIAAAFSSAAIRLHSLAALPPPFFGEPPTPRMDSGAAGDQAGSGYLPAIDPVRRTTATAPPPGAKDDVRNSTPFYTPPRLALDMQAPGEPRRIGPVEGGSSSSPAAAPAQRPSRKRKEGTVTKRVPALRPGNMDTPPDDGYTWRKYGQKDILNSMFPRSYYRCTHKSFYGCDAKKQVQRLDEDPYSFEVTYCGTHTCQTSPTPILIPTQLLPPPAACDAADDDASLMQLEPQQQPRAASATQSAYPSVELHNWLEGSSNPMSLGTLRDFAPAAGSSGRQGGGAQAQQGGGRDLEVTSVADLADAMFNSGGSDSSMDVIFSPRHRN